MSGSPLDPIFDEELSEPSSSDPCSSHEASHVRDSQVPSVDRAVRRVAEYSKTLGLNDPETIAKFAQSCAELTRTDDVEHHAHEAMLLAQRLIADWKKEVFVDIGGEPNPLWLRMVLSQRPDVFLLEPDRARAILGEWGDPRSGQTPATNHFKQQRLSGPRLPRWFRGLLPALLVTGGAVFLLARTIRGDLELLSIAWLAAYAFLVGTTAVGCATAVRGFLEEIVPQRSRRRAPSSSPSTPVTRRRRAQRKDRPKLVAIAVPVYHEDAAQVFANIVAMRETLEACAEPIQFEFFVLSDSRDPWCAADEERALRRVTAKSSATIPIYYRRRVENDRQKAGNIEEFFERWGGRYEYVFILDADSLMQGATMVEMVRRMDLDSKLGMLQAPIGLIGGNTLFCRALQWSTSVVGPLFTRGLASWSGPHGNYYGHNAVIRTEAFLRCCALPTLVGRPPFGGNIMSHDFVEAALLCRGGWEVRTAPDLGGSYEGSPSTFDDYVARDRRWCQGNLQHLRIVGAPGLKMMSRIHLLLGAAAYLAAPAWCIFLLLGIVCGRAGAWELSNTAPFLVLMAVLLFLPRALGALLVLARGPDRKAHGGALAILVTLPLEVLFSSALAPLLLFHHTRIVLEIVFGGFVPWTAQKRNNENRVSFALRSQLGASVVGLSLAFLGLAFAPEYLLVLAPIWAPLCLAVPLSILASSRRVGTMLRAGGLLLVPSETRSEPLLALSKNYKSLTESDQAGRLRDLILDPVLLEAHLRGIESRSGAQGDNETSTSVENPTDSTLSARALRLGPSGLSPAERDRLVRDPASLRWLHQQAWCRWPVEEWSLSRERSQLPENSPPWARLDFRSSPFGLEES